MQCWFLKCRSDNTFISFIRRVQADCILQTKGLFGYSKLYLMLKCVDSVSDEDVNKSGDTMI